MVNSTRAISGWTSRCYKLRNANSGLKQSHLAWNKPSCSELNKKVFVELLGAPCLFQLANQSLEERC